MRLGAPSPALKLVGSRRHRDLASRKRARINRSTSGVEPRRQTTSSSARACRLSSSASSADPDDPVASTAASSSSARPPVRGWRVHVLNLAPLRIEHQNSSASAAARRRRGSSPHTHLHIEALADDSPRIAVEQTAISSRGESRGSLPSADCGAPWKASAAAQGPRPVRIRARCATRTRCAGRKSRRFVVRAGSRIGEKGSEADEPGYTSSAPARQFHDRRSSGERIGERRARSRCVRPRGTFSRHSERSAPPVSPQACRCSPSRPLVRSVSRRGSTLPVGWSRTIGTLSPSMCRDRPNHA